MLSNHDAVLDCGPRSAWIIVYSILLRPPKAVGSPAADIHPTSAVNPPTIRRTLTRTQQSHARACVCFSFSICPSLRHTATSPEPQPQASRIEPSSTPTAPAVHTPVSSENVSTRPQEYGSRPAAGKSVGHLRDVGHVCCGSQSHACACVSLSRIDPFAFCLGAHVMSSVWAG